MNRRIILISLALALACGSLAAEGGDDCPNVQFPGGFPPIHVCAPDATSAELAACLAAAPCSGSCTAPGAACLATACSPSASCVADPDPPITCTPPQEAFSCQFPVGTIDAQCECVTCLMTVEIGNPEVSPGERLRFVVSIEHWRTKTIEAAYSVWVENYGGVVLAGHESPEFLVAYGDSYRNKDSIRIPETMEPGLYRLRFSIARMQQGTMTLNRPFTVVAE